MLEDFIPQVEDEIKVIQLEGLEVKIGDTARKASCQRVNLSMADGKMVTTLLCLGGAYCTMCVKRQEDCQKTTVIEAGFLIDRSIESISDLAESLSDPFTGDITKKKGDYQVRQGICGQPITQTDITKNIPVCHT